MVDVAYAESRFKAPEIPHRYGPRVHLLDDPLAWSLLARACSPETGQPDVGRLVRTLYEIARARRPRRPSSPAPGSTCPPGWSPPTPRPSTGASPSPGHPGGHASGSPGPGTMPSQVVYDLMNEVLDPALVRQDHLFMSRQTNEQGEVIGATWHDAKIGRDVEDRYVLFPDPMGATGSSMVSARQRTTRRRSRAAPPSASRCTSSSPPSTSAASTPTHPDLVVYALRLDRGLSPPAVLRTEPGTHWDRGAGPQRHQYIVPGAGGVGEILNNAWV